MAQSSMLLVPPRVTVAWPCRRPASTAAAASTPRGLRAATEGLLAGRWPDRPDSALSNLSELDSGYDELRSLAVTPVIPPELVVTGPEGANRSLPAEVTSSCEPEVAGDDDDRSASSSDLCQSEDDRRSESSVIEPEVEDVSAHNDGTGNSSAVLLDVCRPNSNASSCKTRFSFISIRSIL